MSVNSENAVEEQKIISIARKLDEIRKKHRDNTKILMRKILGGVYGR